RAPFALPVRTSAAFPVISAVFSIISRTAALWHPRCFSLNCGRLNALSSQVVHRYRDRGTVQQKRRQTMVRKVFSFGGVLLLVGVALLMTPGVSLAQRGGHGGGGHYGGGHYGGGHYGGGHYGGARNGGYGGMRGIDHGFHHHFGGGFGYWPYSAYA